MGRSSHDTYILHIWRSRALAGWQWVARVEHLSDGQRHRFADPEELIAHLRGVALSKTNDGPHDVEIAGDAALEEG
jgi:hypothetical protein